MAHRVRSRPRRRSGPARWRNGADGFFAFLEDVQPHIKDEHGRWVPYTIPNDEVREEIRRAIDSGCGTVVFCWPRRHGKTLVTALIILWRFLTRQNETIALIANSEKQAIDTCFRIVRDALRNTPYTRRMLRDETIKIQAQNIQYEGLGNSITGYPNNPSVLYGIAFSIVQVSELHAARDIEAFNTVSGSTMDRADGLILVDSTVGSQSSPLWVLWQTNQTDPDADIHFSYINYRDLEDAIQNLPSWLSEARLRTLAATMLPLQFAQQHLNQWQAGSSCLFPPNILDMCRDQYPINVEALTSGAAYVVGSGLDRAYGFSLHGDQTVATAVLRVLDGEDDHFYVLASDSIRFSSASGIKKALSRYEREYQMTRAAIESYNAQDIAAWCGDQKFDHELVHATSDRQSNAFTALYNAAAEGRLHIHPSYEKLLEEMAVFEYRLENVTGKGTVPKFEAATGSHDDHVYSLAWAVYSLRDIELNPYEIAGIHCFANAIVAPLCVLNGGTIVPACSEQCRSFGTAADLYQKYEAKAGAACLKIEDFITQKLENVGSYSASR